jgi:hypothetical protein
VDVRGIQIFGVCDDARDRGGDLLTLRDGIVVIDVVVVGILICFVDRVVDGICAFPVSHHCCRSS